MCIAEIVHLSAGFLYVRILGENDMYCLSCPLVRQLSICHNPTIKLYLFPRWSTCTPAVYMSESKQEMICIAQMVHLSDSCPYVRILKGNETCCLDGPLVCQLSICQNHNMNDIYCLDCPIVCQLSICQNPNRKNMYFLDGPIVCTLSICHNPNST